MSPLQKYLMQRQAMAEGEGPRGGGGMAAKAVGPGIADPFTEGDEGSPLANPDDGMNEFDPRRRTRPYLGDGGLAGGGGMGAAPVGRPYLG